MTRYFLLTMVLGIVLTASGCKGDNSSEVVEDPPVVAFEGKPDARFVGAWSRTSGIGIYTFKQDGTYNFKGQIMNRGQKMPVDVNGEWKVKDNLFLIRTNGAVAKKTFSLAGNQLTLSLTGRMKLDEVLIKK